MKKTVYAFMSLLFMLASSCELPETEIRERVNGDLEFSGYLWEVKDSQNQQVGPGPNYFSAHPFDIYVDQEGYLHMKIVERDGAWRSTECITRENMGYGTYTWTIEGDFVNMPDNITLGLFTWDNNTFFSQANSEVDVEMAKWGEDTPHTVNYAVQPVAFGPYYPERVHRADSTGQYLIGIHTHQINWTDTLVSFYSYTGETTDADKLISTWEFGLDNPARVKNEGGSSSVPIVIPAPGETTNARINLWMYRDQFTGPADGEPQEFIIRSFSYEPMQ